MIRTILFFTILWISLLISMILIIPVLVLKLIGQKKPLNTYVRIVTSRWSYIVLYLSGIKTEYSAPEPFPEGPFVIISNHQGYFDIPVLLSVLPISPAFIAKKELKNLPFFNIWMNSLECLFIDRSDSPGSRRKIMNRLNTKGMNPLLLFPEGTRSQGNNLKSFRTGGLKMVFDSNTSVLPVRLNGTYKLWEEKGRIRAGKVKVEVLPLIHAHEYKNSGFGGLLGTLKNTLRNPEQS
jgi:1-acyl-sn-glycerol-3-phosphate acyltransferase